MNDFQLTKETADQCDEPVVAGTSYNFHNVRTAYEDCIRNKFPISVIKDGENSKFASYCIIFVTYRESFYQYRIIVEKQSNKVIFCCECYRYDFRCRSFIILLDEKEYKNYIGIFIDYRESAITKDYYDILSSRIIKKDNSGLYHQHTYSSIGRINEFIFKFKFENNRVYHIDILAGVMVKCDDIVLSLSKIISNLKKELFMKLKSIYFPYSGKYGFCDENNHTVITDKYVSVTEFHTAGNKYLAVVSEDGVKYGAIDTYGGWVIEPKYDYFSKFNDNGFATVYYLNKQYYIDSDGNLTQIDD